MKQVGNGIELIAWDSDPLTEQEVLAVERAVGPLPADYRMFLLTSNGGRAAADFVRFPLSDLVYSDYAPLDSFEDVEAAFPPKVLQVEVGGTRQDLIRVAECADSPYLMQLGGSRAGFIYYWIYDYEEHAEAENAGRDYLPDEDSLTEVASSFADFVNGLIADPPAPVPRLTTMPRTAENFAKYGDNCFDEAKAFFDSMTLDELNASGALRYAAGWSQVQTCKLLIDRGVDLQAAVRCTNQLEITRLMINAGAAQDQLQTTLLSAAAGMHATTVPEQSHDIIMELLASGIRPNFSDDGVLLQWQQAMDQIYAKKILAFLLRVFDFPASIAEPMRARIASRRPW